MKNKILILTLSVVTILTGFLSCKDDDEPTVTVEIRDRAEQQLADKDSLIDYLMTHYYNSSFIASAVNPKYTDIVITELPQDEDGNYLEMPDPTENTLLIDAVEIVSASYLDVDYEYYILRLNQGGGASPRFTDAVRVRYEGSSVDSGNTFDGVVSPIELNLQGNGFTTFGTIKAWQLILPTFNSAADFTLNSGVVDYNDYGFGVMFVPSGLAYFAGITTGSAYDNLIFKFELLQMEELDHDGDGVPSYLEDLDNNEDVGDDDTDGDLFANYIDNDDDGDGVLTINEDIDGDGDPTNDIGANGIPRYLDPEETDSNTPDE